MKNLKILLGIGALIILLFLVINAVYAPVTLDEYEKACLLVLKDAYREGGKFSREEALDLVDFYLSERNLDNCVNVVGSKSGEPIHYLLFKAGNEECMENYTCSPPGAHCCKYDEVTGNYIEYVCA